MGLVTVLGRINKCLKVQTIFIFILILKPQKRKSAMLTKWFDITHYLNSTQTHSVGLSASLYPYEAPSLFTWLSTFCEYSFQGISLKPHQFSLYISRNLENFKSSCNKCNLFLKKILKSKLIDIITNTWYLIWCLCMIVRICISQIWYIDFHAWINCCMAITFQI